MYLLSRQKTLNLTLTSCYYFKSTILHCKNKPTESTWNWGHLHPHFVWVDFIPCEVFLNLAGKLNICQYNTQYKEWVIRTPVCYCTKKSFCLQWTRRYSFLHWFQYSFCSVNGETYTELNSCSRPQPHHTLHSAAQCNHKHFNINSVKCQTANNNLISTFTRLIQPCVKHAGN